MLSIDNSLFHSNLNNIKREILFKVDTDGIITDIEPEIINFLGYSHKEMIGVKFYEFLSIENNNFTFSNSTFAINNITLILKHKNNQLLYFDISYRLVLASDNKPVEIYASMIDVSKYKANEQRLEMIDNILDNSKDIIYHYQVFPERKFLYLSKSVEDVLGHRVDFHYKNPMHVFETAHIDDVAELERKVSGKVDYSKSVITRWKHQNGTYLWMEDYPIPVYDYSGNYTGVQGICRDISEKIALREKLEYLLSHDNFTGLRNRAYWDQELKRYNDIEDISMGIIICDSDNLKVINDSLGHSKGDFLIKNIAILLSKFSNDNRIISRLGGDEFAILIKNTSKLEVIKLCNEIHSLISKYNLENKDFQIGLSLGSAFSETSLNKTNSIFKIADKNMYIDKNNRKNIRVTSLKYIQRN